MLAHDTNALGQPIGKPLDGEFPRPYPPHVQLSGHYGSLVPLTKDHAEGLHIAFSEAPDISGWTYLPIDPWPDLAAAQRWCDQAQDSRDPQFYTILDQNARPSGFCSLLRITPDSGCIEVGFIHFAHRLQRTALATEAMYLLMRHVFDDLGYRRYEWKCDALNAPSKAAAQRLGFSYEGLFRQATHYKGRNRDTAWFSILDHEWPALKTAFEQWLAPENFDDDSLQRQSLNNFRG